MITPLQRMRNGLLAMLSIVIVAILGFKFLAGYAWLDAIWMVVITISTVGYGENSQTDPATKILSMFVILLGVTASAYLFTGIIQMILQGEIDKALGKRRLEKQISQLTCHTIVCGFGKSGPMLAEQLKSQNQTFVIVDSNSDQYGSAVNAGYLALLADATDEEVLKQLGIQEAKAIIIALPTDAENVFITLSARNLCPEIRIVAQAERESSSVKLRQAGADEVVMGHQMVASHMARLVTRPSTAKFFALLNQAENLDLELDEFEILADSPIVGKTIAELRVRDAHSLLVVAVKPKDGNLNFNPVGSYVFATAETVLVMGKSEDIERFRAANHLKVA
jgi:voltage-gated potassium channel